MNKIKLLFLSVAVVFSLGLDAQKKSSKSSATATQKKSENNGLLWEISGNDLKKPSYLFGTFHMMCKDQYKVPAKVAGALESTDNLIMEINFSDPKTLMEMQNMLISEREIVNEFSEQEREEFSSQLKELGFDIDDVNKMSEIAFFSAINSKSFNCKQSELKMIDLELMQKAMQTGKSVFGLETVDEQVKMFKNYLTKDEILSMVKNAEKNKKLTNNMLEYYSNEDLLGMNEMMQKNNSMTEEQRVLMLDSRNLKWIGDISNLIMEKSSFIAVGAGHLMGEKGLIELLRQQGFKVNAK